MTYGLTFSFSVPVILPAATDWPIYNMWTLELCNYDCVGLGNRTSNGSNASDTIPTTGDIVVSNKKRVAFPIEGFQAGERHPGYVELDTSDARNALCDACFLGLLAICTILSVS